MIEAKYLGLTANKLAKIASDLDAENAKLRKRLDQYELFECVVGDPSTEFARLRRELHRLQRENAKLREFAKLAWGLLTMNEPQFVWESMLNDAHALGIEVKW